jgi:hypothetical protein
MLTNTIPQLTESTPALERRLEVLLRQLEALGVEMVDTPEIIVSAPGSIVLIRDGQPVEFCWWGYERVPTEQNLSYLDVLRRIGAIVPLANRGEHPALGPLGRALLRSWLEQNRPAWEQMDLSEWERSEDEGQQEAPREAGRTRAELLDEGWY